MEKVDFKKALRDLFTAPRGSFVLIEVPEMQYLMIDGRGDPSTSPAYQDAIEALYAVSYKVKFTSKKTLERDYVVPPLEGLWGSEVMISALGEVESEEEWLRVFQASNREEWTWTMMIMQPDWIDNELIDQSREQVREAKDLPALELLRTERLAEGLSVQTLHIGPYAEEGPILAKMHLDYIPANALLEDGLHHEIYLSDPRRTAPEKLKTVLRQPVRESK
ncbi:MAG: GyrI-like domain-containing protein [Anaerolineales bacterium]|jgi:hypothetical protein